MALLGFLILILFGFWQLPLWLNHVYFVELLHRSLNSQRIIDLRAVLTLVLQNVVDHVLVPLRCFQRELRQLLANGWRGQIWGLLFVPFIDPAFTHFLQLFVGLQFHALEISERRALLRTIKFVMNWRFRSLVEILVSWAPFARLIWWQVLSRFFV